MIASESSPASENRLSQIEANLNANELRILLENREAIRQYVELGTRLGVFALSEEDTENNGRDIVLREASCSVVAVMIERGIAIPDGQPQDVAAALLDVTEQTHTENDSPVTVKVEREQLAENQPDSDPLEHVIAAHNKSHPAWFTVINNGIPALGFLAPSDLQAIYSAVDHREWHGAVLHDIESILEDAREGETSILS